MKKFFRIIVKGPIPQVFYDYEVPDTASLPQFWSNIVASGYVLTEKFVILADQVASIQEMRMEQAQSGSFTPRIVN